jgi:hypothetical protein
MQKALRRARAAKAPRKTRMKRMEEDDVLSFGSNTQWHT